MARILTLALVFGLTQVSMAQTPEPEESHTYLKFLSTGDFVRVQTMEGSASVILSTYSKPRYELAKVIASHGRRMLNAKELAAENEVAQKELEDFLSQNKDKSFDEEKLDVFPLIRTSLGRVIEVGADYVLVELDGESKRQCVLPARSIGKIYLDASPIRFSGPRRISDS